MLVDQLRLLVDHRGDDVCRVSATIAFTVSTSQPVHRGQVLPHPLHLVVVRAAEQIHELGIGTAQDGTAVDQPAGVERPGERQRARTGDYGLVQIEEGGRSGRPGVRHEVEHRHRGETPGPGLCVGRSPLDCLQCDSDTGSGAPDRRTRRLDDIWLQPRCVGPVLGGRYP